MRYIYTILFITIGGFQTTQGQNHGIEQNYFDNIGGVFFTEEGIPIVAQDGSDFKGLVLDTNDYSISQELIRKGKGPGEINRLYAFGFDKQKNQLCLIGFQLRLICSDLQGNTTRDERIPWLEFSGVSSPTEFYFHDSNLILTHNSLLSVDQPASKIQVAAITSNSNLSEVKYLTIPFDELGFDYLKSLTLADNIFIKPKLIQLAEDITVVGISGLPYLYIFKDGTFHSKILLDTVYEVRFEVSQRADYPSPGVLVPANMNSLSNLGNNHFLIARGNIYQEIPTGMDVYKLELEEDVFTVEDITKIALNDLPGDLSEPKVTIHNNTAYIISNYIFFAYEIAVKDLQDILK